MQSIWTSTKKENLPFDGEGDSYQKNLLYCNYLNEDQEDPR